MSTDSMALPKTFIEIDYPGKHAILIRHIPANDAFQLVRNIGRGSKSPRRDLTKSPHHPSSCRFIFYVHARGSSIEASWYRSMRKDCPS